MDNDAIGRQKCKANQKRNTFRTLERAMAAVENLNARDALVKVHAFPCRFCGKFHIGRIRTAEERAQRVAEEERLRRTAPKH